MPHKSIHKESVEEQLENLHNEVGALRRAVESKGVAITILRKELQECQSERDKFRTLAEDHPVSQPHHTVNLKSNRPEETKSAFLSGGEVTITQLLCQSKEENKILRMEMTELRCKLHDAQSDLKVLREEKSRQNESARRLSSSTSQMAREERQNFIQQMEKLASKCSDLEKDVRMLLEEREELIVERDENKLKLHRLNHVLNLLLNKGTPESLVRSIDLDAIISENRYLKQRVKQIKEEVVLATTSVSKYKSLLEEYRTKTHTLKPGSTGSIVLSTKQVSDLLTKYEGQLNREEESDMKSVCVSLLDALNQKTKLVKSQKAANKLLVDRVNCLEKRLSTTSSSTTSPVKMCHEELSQYPLSTEVLMDGYIPPKGVIAAYDEALLSSSPVKDLLEKKTLDSSSFEEDLPVATGSENSEMVNEASEVTCTKISNATAASNTFELSDYESDDENLEKALQEWAKECNPKSPTKKSKWGKKDNIPEEFRSMFE